VLALDPDQQRSLDTAGVARLPGVVDRGTAATMADAVWRSLAPRGIQRAAPTTWPAGAAAKLGDLKRAGVFDAFDAPAVRALGDALLGAGRWIANGSWGPALITFPEPEPWALPHQVWHLDEPGRGDPDHPRVLRLFGYATDVAPRGGATLAVAGSHELVRRMVAAAPGWDVGSSAQVRKRLVAEHPWFQALSKRRGTDRIARFMEDGEEIDGVHVRVVELTAGAGDVVVMLPWTLHNISMNCARAPRFMVTQTLLRVA
jgi:hypothetical protein